MKFDPRHSWLWFFVWSTGTPYPTAICAFDRKTVIEEVVKAQGEPWKRTYRRGGRVMKCRVTPLS